MTSDQSKWVRQEDAPSDRMISSDVAADYFRSTPTVQPGGSLAGND